MSCNCGCCTGLSPRTPAPVSNRPGLDAIRYRIGDHAAFFESMLAMLSGRQSAALDGLRTREPDDPAIAWLDAWATVADVLTFYQERIANEGYLRTATERRSIVELARLVGYAPRPGVAASVALAFEIEQAAGRTVVPRGTRCQSLPGPNELPQPFESSADVVAGPEWNRLPVRRTEPLRAGQFFDVLHLAGANTGLRENDWILESLLTTTDTGQTSSVRLHKIRSLEPDVVTGRTTVSFVQPEDPLRPAIEAGLFEYLKELEKPGSEGEPSLLSRLETEVTLQPRNPTRLTRDAGSALAPDSDNLARLAAHLRPKLGDTLLSGLGSFRVAPGDVEIRFFAVTEAKLFGHNAPDQVVTDVVRESQPAREVISTRPVPWPIDPNHTGTSIFLDTAYPQVREGDLLLLQRPTHDTGLSAKRLTETIATPGAVDSSLSVAAYGMSGKSTRVDLGDVTWIGANDLFQAIRESTVYVASRRLEIADQPIDPVQRPVQGSRIALQTIVGELEPGRWLIVEGERLDVAPLTGVRAAELVMLGGVEHSVSPESPDDAVVPGDAPHTTLILAEPLAYVYRRDSVVVHGNVAKATHGETRIEVLGSGDGSRPFQGFTLKQSPLTYLAAPTAKGAESTLAVRVNDLLWKAAGSFAELAPDDRRYVVRTDDDQVSTVVFGDGTSGARLPTGRENVKAVYRTGIGPSGNVAAGQISILSSRPLGLKGVVNPIRASGGGDRDTIEQARRNTPLALQALDRLISVADYAFFARGFAGIGKASAALLARDGRPLVHVTIAGAGDAPIDPPSDLYQNLLEALRLHGDPSLSVELALRNVRFLVVSADVTVDADYLWEAVYAQLRAAMYDAFSFDRRDLGQPAYLGDVFRVMQGVPGVVAVDVNVFDDVSLSAPLSSLTEPGLETQIEASLATQGLPIRPADLVYLNPALPETLIINRREP